MPETSSTQIDTTYKIPVTEAVSYTTNWRKSGATIKAFTVDVQELNDIIDELKGVTKLPIDQIRIYFGIKGDGAEALVLVGVSKGQDVVEYVNSDGDVESGTYDFTRPCPSTCDEESILNGAGTNN